MSATLLRTNSKHKEYQKLVTLLDKEIRFRDGEDFEFFNQFNSSEHINEVVLFMENNTASGCGAIKQYDSKTAEIKRMFTLPESRGKGVATQILEELEKWAKELGNVRCILETGKKYTEAVALYTRYGFKIIENYGPYAEVEDSVCFQKEI